MPDEEVVRKEYAKYRIGRAKEDLNTAHRLLADEDYRAANNRAYYAIFHSMRAVLALDGFDSKKHSGIISEFRKKYIKGGIFPVEISQMIGSAFTIRNASDYDDMFLASRKETEMQVANADRVHEAVCSYLQGMIVG